MATVDWDSSGVSDSSDVSSHVVNLNNAVSSDDIIVSIGMDARSGDHWVVPSGWTEVLRSTGECQFIVIKKTDGGEANVTISSGSQNCRAIWRVLKLSGYDLDSIDADEQDQDDVGGVLPFPPPVTVTGGPKDILSFIVGYLDNAENQAAPSSGDYDTNFDFTNNSGGTRVSLGSSWRTATSVTTETPGVMTGSGSDDHSAGTVLIPVAGGTDTEITTNSPDALLLDEKQATIANDVTVSAEVDALAIAENQATITFDVNVEAATDALTLTEFQATLTADVSISASTDELVLTEQAATVSLDIDIQSSTDALSVATHTAGIGLNASIGAATAALALVANAATIGFDVEVQAGVDALTLTEQTATLSADTEIDATTDALTLSEKIATIDFDVPILEIANSPAVETTASGTDITITHGMTFSAGDVIIVTFHSNNTPLDLTAPSGKGFTRDYTEQGSATNTYAIFSKVSTGTEDSSWTFDSDGSATTMSIIVRAFSGVDATIWDVAPSASTRSKSSGDDTTAIAPTMTTNNDGALGFVFVSTDTTTMGYNSPTNGYGNEAEESVNRPQASYTRTWDTAGATGTTSVTVEETQDWTAHQFALKPDAGATVIAATTDALTLAEQAATIVYDVAISATTDALTLTGQTATVALATTVDATTDALLLAEQAATVSLDIDIQATTDALTLAEQAATLVIDTTVSAGTDALVLTEFTASLSKDSNVSAATDALTLTENQATIVYDVNVLAGTDALTLTELPANLTADTEIATTADALSLVEQAATIVYDVNVLASTDSLTLAEFAASLSEDSNISATTAALVLTEYTASLSEDSNIAASTDTLTLSEQAASIGLNVDIQAITDALTLTGLTASMGGDVNVIASTDALSLVEQAAAIAADTNVLAGTDALVLTEYQTVAGLFEPITEPTTPATNQHDNGTTISITHGMSFQANDLILVTVHANNLGLDLTAPSGKGFARDFTEASASSSTYAIFTKFSDGTEDASWTFSQDGPASHMSIIVRTFRGVAPAIWDVAPAAGTRTKSTVNGTTATAPTMTTVSDGAKGIVYVAVDTNDPLNFTSPTNGYANEAEVGTDRPQVSYTRTWDTAGVTGSVDITLSITQDWVAHQFALVPGTNILATTDALLLTEQAASIAYDRNVLAGTDALVLTEQAAQIGLGTVVAAGVDALTLTEQAATVDKATEVLAGTDALLLAEQAAAIIFDKDVAATTDALTLAEQAGTIIYDKDVLAGTDALLLAGQTATIFKDTTVAASTDALVLAGQTATAGIDQFVAAATDAMTLTEFPVTLTYDVDVLAGTDALILVGQQARILKDEFIAASTDALVLTEFTGIIDIVGDIIESPFGRKHWRSFTQGFFDRPFPLLLTPDIELLATVDALSLTTYQASLAHDRDVAATTDALVLTGQQAAVSTAFLIQANTAAMTVAEQAATIANDVNVAAGTDALALTTYMVEHPGFTIETNIDALAIATFGASFSYDVTVSANTAALTITENAASVFKGAINANTAALVITESQASISIGGPAAFDYIGIPYVTDPVPSALMPTLPTGADFTNHEWIGTYDPCLITTPTAPATVTANEWVVDKFHGSATDVDLVDNSIGGVVYGTTARPRLTIPTDTTFSAGSKIFIYGDNTALPTDWNSAGRQRDYDRWDTATARTWNGTSGSPCWVVGIDKPRVQLDRLEIENSEHLIWDGIVIESPGNSSEGGRFEFLSCSYVTFRNGWCYGGEGNFGGRAVGWKGTSGSRNQFMCWFNNEMAYHGDFNLAVGSQAKDRHCFTPDDYSTWMWIIDCTIHHFGADGMQANPPGGETSGDHEKRPHYMYYAGCTGYWFKENFADFKTSYHGIVSENTVLHSEADAIILPNNDEGALSGYHWALFNDITQTGPRGTGNGIRPGGDQTDEYSGVIGNFVHDIPKVGILSTRADAGNATNNRQYIVNNTVVRCDGGFEAHQRSNPGVGDYIIDIQGNLIYDCDLEMDFNGSGMTPALVTMIDNLLWDPGSTQTINGSGLIDVEINTIEADPVFNNPTGDTAADFVPSAAAIDQTSPHQVYQDFEDLYGISIRFDILGTARPQGADYDIGALEST